MFVCLMPVSPIILLTHEGNDTDCLVHLVLVGVYWAFIEYMKEAGNSTNILDVKWVIFIFEKKENQVGCQVSFTTLTVVSLFPAKNLTLIFPTITSHRKGPVVFIPWKEIQKRPWSDLRNIFTVGKLESGDGDGKSLFKNITKKTEQKVSCLHRRKEASGRLGPLPSSGILLSSVAPGRLAEPPCSRWRHNGSLPLLAPPVLNLFYVNTTLELGWIIEAHSLQWAQFPLALWNGGECEHINFYLPCCSQYIFSLLLIWKDSALTSR